jgi:uncharacterized BrkB/YihY/UPF0761 family membrane protein
VFSSVCFSSAIISGSRLYGTIGVVFTLMTWFIAIGAVIVPGAVAGATRDERKATKGWLPPQPHDSLDHVWPILHRTAYSFSSDAE